MTTIVNDAKLEQLAVLRPKDLLPILERTASLSPLLVVLTFLPGIIALKFATVNEVDARWRLKSLELSTVSSVLDAFDPSIASSQRALKWQPPLGSWIAAISVHLPWPISTRGLELTDYLCAAALVPASYFLASRLMGRRVGFLTAVLVAFHATFLEQHQHAAPHVLAVVTAFGAFWGFLGHLWRADELVSFDLLCGGISLGLCLLAGGPLAIVVVAVLLLLVLGRYDPPRDLLRAAPLRGRRMASGWLAFKSLGILVATAFAAGGWWELMMVYSYGSDFLTSWLWGTSADPTLAHALPALTSGAFLVQLIREFLATAGALAGLTALGLFVIIRGLLNPPHGAPRANYLFLAAWTSCAFLLFAAALRDPARGSLNTDLWRLFLMSACTVCSAVALDEIARRRVNAALAAGLTLATLAGAQLVLHSWVVRAPWAWAACGLAVIVVVYQIPRFYRRSETHKRFVLLALIGVQVLADASLGIAAVRTKHFESESLTVFMRSLPPGIDADACLLISEKEAPSRLQLVLKSVWQGAQLSLVSDWDQALKAARGNTQTPKSAVVVDWSQGNSRPANPTGAHWSAEPIGNPQFFQERQLRAYVLVWD